MIPDTVIANSGATLGTLGLNERDRAAAIYSGIDLSARMRVVHDGMQQPQLREQSRLDDNGVADRRIGLVGRISPWKGQHIFIRAAAQVHRQFPQTRFLIIGSALFQEQSYESEIRNLVRELGLEACVEFTGFRVDVAAAIGDLEILVHASTTGEPFGQVVIEGMAAGKPVVATNGGGIPEIVRDGVSGLLVPMNDHEAMAMAICRLLEDPEMAKRMGSFGQQRVREYFTIQQTASKVERLYDDLLAGGRTVTPSIDLRANGPSPAATRAKWIRRAFEVALIVGIATVFGHLLQSEFPGRAPVTLLLLLAVVAIRKPL